MAVLITDQEPAPPKTDFLAAAAPWAETLSKGVAGLVIAIYACGFLIVSLYHSQFGFVGTNPFRPKVLAAGVWFFLLTTIPISIALTFRLNSWRSVAKNAASVWIACIGLSGLLSNLIFHYTLFDTTKAHPVIHIPIWGWIIAAIVWVASVIATAPNSSFKPPEWVVITASILLAVLYLVNPAFSFFNHEFDFTTLAFWFFAASLVGLLEFKVRTRDSLTSFGGWAKPVGVILGALLIFSQYLYPHIKASWGGGVPADVVIYFTKDSLIDPGKCTQAQLIEESDEGFYIVGPKESKAIFVPRSAVALIYFGDKILDSPLLKGTK
jgi:hypothetical protein